MNILENINELENKISEKLNLCNMQENYLVSSIGTIANTAIDFGLRALLPDSIENEVIKVKDAFITGGLSDGIQSAIQNSIEIGKRMLGIEGKEFTSIGQAQETVEKGNVTGEISESIDSTINKIQESGTLSDEKINLIKEQKDSIMENVNSSIENNFNNEIKALEKIEKYIENWKKYYSKHDLESLTKEYNKIEKQAQKIMPLKNIIKNIETIQNINELIKNSPDFNFDSVYLDLAGNI